ncbi:cation channel sperm-associated protein 1 [Acomys russatus]|uniref:cation channel sperm-associated protein 1 n=1 Tax=Acomys russatus TaxID=60746 RepID=UPI0021E2AE99|nr:cation channel sperm-associated protein 1 [Acomys russatus]
MSYNTLGRPISSRPTIVPSTIKTDPSISQSSHMSTRPLDRTGPTSPHYLVIPLNKPVGPRVNLTLVVSLNTAVGPVVDLTPMGSLSTMVDPMADLTPVGSLSTVVGPVVDHTATVSLTTAVGPMVDLTAAVSLTPVVGPVVDLTLVVGPMVGLTPRLSHSTLVGPVVHTSPRLSHFTPGQPQHGLHAATPSGRPHHRKQSFLGDTLPTHSLEEPYQEGPSFQDDAYYESHQPSHRHGERPHRRDHYRHGERPHHREHFAPNDQSPSQLSVPFKSQTTLGASSSRLGGKSSSYLGPRSYTSRISSKIYPEDSKESGSWNEEEQTHKRKSESSLGPHPRFQLPHSDSRAQRGHRKLHSGNIFQLMMDKINFLIWGLREMMMSLTESLFFETFIFIIVCLNTIVLVAQTFTELEIRGEWYFMVLDSIFLAIYILEALLKLIALGMEYFYDPWNNLDFFIMVMAVLDFALLQTNSLSYSFYNHSLFRILKVFKSMRALRAIRVLRRLSILTSLHEVTGTLRGSLMSITAILFLMFTCLFLFSVVLRALFGKSDPKRFQNIFTTLFTLFTMLTLDDWSLIYMDNRAEGAWYIIPILMIYIVIQYFIFLNLVIAVLVDSFQMALLKGLEKVKMEKAARIHEKLLDDSLTDLNQALSLHADPEAKLSEGTLKMQLIEKMFGTMTESQREKHFQYLQLVAAVEQHQQKFRSQASVIDEIVDTTFEAAEDEFGK